jgi:hypothetical protein
MLKSKNQSVWFIFDYDKHVYEWPLSELKDNGIMIDIWFVTKF